jgi:hypothetical protein
MNFSFTGDPKLIESNTKSYLTQCLTKCHENRVRIYHIILNVAIVIVFGLVFGFALYICHTKKLTPYEKYRKMLRDQEYILTKIREYQIQKMRQHESLTNLPDTYVPAVFQ